MSRQLFYIGSLLLTSFLTANLWMLFWSLALTSRFTPKLICWTALVGVLVFWCGVLECNLAHRWSLPSFGCYISRVIRRILLVVHCLYWICRHGVLVEAWYLIETRLIPLAAECLRTVPLSESPGNDQDSRWSCVFVGVGLEGFMSNENVFFSSLSLSLYIYIYIYIYIYLYPSISLYLSLSLFCLPLFSCFRYAGWLCVCSWGCGNLRVFSLSPSLVPLTLFQ